MADGGGDSWTLVRETVGNGRLSVIMPVFRLEDGIRKNLRAVAELFEGNGVSAELVPVDDGSPDGTAEEVRLAAAEAAAAGWRHVTFRPVFLPRNGGKGGALRAGFVASSGEWILLLDGDLDISPRQTPAFFEAAVRENADIVAGSKRHPLSRVQYPWHRRLASAVYHLAVRLLAGLAVTDTQTGMKLFRRRVLGDALSRMLVKKYAFDLELLAIARRLGAKIAEAPVEIRFGQKFGALSPSTVKSMVIDTLAVFYRLRILDYYAKPGPPAAAARPPSVTVVIACPGPSAVLDECLAALAAQDYPDFETIVLPDAPGLTLPAGRFREISTGKVRPAEKRNIGIAAAKGEVVAFIDDDAFPAANWLEYAARYFADPSVGAVGGPGATPPGDTFLARAGGRVYDSILVSGNYRYRYRAGGVRRDVDDYPSCNLFVRTSLLCKIGGYRTDFWPGEDTLLCKDIVDAGFRIIYDPWVAVYHHRRKLFGPHLRQLGRYAFHRGYFVRRFPSNSLHLPYFVPTFFAAYLAVLACVALAALLPGAAGAWRTAAVWCAVPLAVYGALVLLASFSRNPAMWLLTAAGTVASHLVYGVRFAQGLLARKAPCEFIGADHCA